MRHDDGMMALFSGEPALARWHQSVVACSIRSFALAYETNRQKVQSC